MASVTTTTTSAASGYRRRVTTPTHLSPPASPLREDEPDGPMAPSDETIQGEAERELQEENAETSLDQPST